MISKKYLREQILLRKSLDPNSYSSANENMTIFRSKGNKYDLFLSHSFKDKELIFELRSLFNKAGYSVYIDWIDDENLDRSNVNGHTAKIIRSRIKECKGLSYIATSNIESSKWCPWELGFADGLLNQRTCILPIIENSDFNGQEYLGLYPYIDYATSTLTKKLEFWVIDANNIRKYITLKSWLDGSELVEH